MRLTNDQCWANLATVDHGVLCTTGAHGAIDAVPVCFVVVGKVIASPIDTVKAKDTTELGRLKNLEATRRPRCCASSGCATTGRGCGGSGPSWSVVRATTSRRHCATSAKTALRHKYFQYRGTEFADLLVFEREGAQRVGGIEDPDGRRRAMSGDGDAVPNRLLTTEELTY